MAQDHAWTDDTFAGGHVAATDLQNMENNFLALKTNFTGNVAPSSPEEGQTWTDTNTKIIKKYDGASWQDFIDYGNVKMAVDTVQTTSIKNVNVTAAKLATDAVETIKIKNGAVTGVKLLPNVALIKTGTYTGDGNPSQAITGIGFQVKFVKVWRRPDTDNASALMFESVDGFTGGFSVRHISSGHAEDKDAIVSLDIDGFTVEDNGGAGLDPNKSGETYDYVAFGAAS